MPTGLFVQVAPLIEPWVGPWGVFFALGFNAALIYIAFRAQRRAKAAEAWKSAAEAASAEAAAMRGEKETWKETAARERQERSEMAQELGRLQAATDLTQLTKDNQQEHRAIIEALGGVRQSVDDNTKALLGFQSQNAGAFEVISESLRHTAASLRMVESRLSEKGAAVL